MPPRSRYATLAATGLTLALAYGTWYSYGVFLVALLAEFGWSRSVLAGAFSVFTLVHGAVNPLLGYLCDRIGPRRIVTTGGVLLGIALASNSLVSEPWHLYLTFGGFCAVTVAMCGWTPAVVLVQRTFIDRLGLAIGIVSSGVGFGMLLVVPFCQLLIDHYGWRVGFQGFGLLCTSVIVPASWLFLRDAPPPPPAPAPRAAPAEPESASAPRIGRASAALDLRLSDALRTAPFWLIVATMFFGNICSQTMHVHQVAFLVDHGMQAIVAASVVGVVGVASVFGKTGSGWLSDRIEREKIYVIGIGIMIASVGALTLVGTAPTRWGAYGYAVLLGLGYSVTAALVPAMMRDRFRGAHFGAIFGAGHIGSAAGSALGPWLAGRLFDVTGSYAIPLAIAAACGVVCAAASWTARMLRVRAAALG